MYTACPSSRWFSLVSHMACFSSLSLKSRAPTDTYTPQTLLVRRAGSSGWRRPKPTLQVVKTKYYVWEKKVPVFKRMEKTQADITGSFFNMCVRVCVCVCVCIVCICRYDIYIYIYIYIHIYIYGEGPSRHHR
jgi:hypothetical protein